jgi:hypothetical protein
LAIATRRARVPALAAMAMLAAAGLRAQSLPTPARATDVGLAGWMTAWSPLAPLADLPRIIPRAASLADLLGAPPPAVGLFWVAGTPAALGFEVTSRRGQMSAGLAGDDGSYRRALDPTGVAASQLSGIGWQPVGAHAAAAGRVVLAQQAIRSAAESDVLQPSASDPFVITDTTRPRMRRLGTQLEGALGWRFGSWGAGIGGALLIEDFRTRLTRFPRLGKATTPAAALGISRALPWAEVRLAVFGRWMGGNETVLLPATAAPGRLYILDGYSDPDPLDIQPSTPFFRRTERDAFAWGLGASGSLAGASWVAFAERTRRTDDHFSARIENPPTDRWHATGSAYGLAAQWAVPRYDLLVTAGWRYERLHGDATRADLTGIIFRASERVWHATAEVRYTPAASPWLAAATVALNRESRRREDFIAETRSDLKTWTPGVGLEVARVFGATAISAGYAIAFYEPFGGIPDPSSLGPIYQRLIAPELALYGTGARPTRATLTLRHTFPSGTALLLTARRESVGASGDVLTTTLPYTPKGSRTLWNVSLGVVIGQ